jgi:hypothetical protein
MIFYYFSWQQNEEAVNLISRGKYMPSSTVLSFRYQIFLFPACRSGKKAAICLPGQPGLAGEGSALVV